MTYTNYNTETLLTEWWCNQSVYYHTNGYGDCVLFDRLGFPWQIHYCWAEYWEEEKIKRKIAQLTIFSVTSNITELKLHIFNGVILKIQKHENLITLEIIARYMGLTIGKGKDDYDHLFLFRLIELGLLIIHSSVFTS